MQFKRKQIIVEAMQLTSEVRINDLTRESGDWLVKMASGALEVMRDSDFRQDYEPLKGGWPDDILPPLKKRTQRRTRGMGASPLSNGPTRAPDAGEDATAPSGE